MTLKETDVLVVGSGNRCVDFDRESAPVLVEEFDRRQRQSPFGKRAHERAPGYSFFPPPDDLLIEFFNEAFRLIGAHLHAEFRPGTAHGKFVTR